MRSPGPRSGVASAAGWLAAFAAAVIGLACGGVGAGQGRPNPERKASPSSSSTAVVNRETLSANLSVRASSGIFIGGDDHVSLVVDNTGRDIGQLGVGMGLYDRWLAHHTLAMGTSARCNIDRAIDGFDCGPLKSGESVGLVLRATPDDAGTFKYGLRLYERANGSHQVITKADGGDLVATFEETVTPLKS
jgi:hypothetical protein